MLTAPQLFAGVSPTGDERCFFCGGKCGEEVAAEDFVKSSFTSLDTVTLSSWVCLGCVASQSEDCTITLADGEVRHGQRVRCYSWVIFGVNAIAATKAHREWLVSQCLSPPSPPFVICLSDSGQKHLLYRAVVNHSRDLVTATLESERVTYRPSELADRLRLATQLCAATGKPALSEELSPQAAMRVYEYFDSDELLTAWSAVASEPLSRLAVWLAPKKEDCERDFPRQSGAAAASSRAVTRHRGAQAHFSWLD